MAISISGRDIIEAGSGQSLDKTPERTRRTAKAQNILRMAQGENLSAAAESARQETDIRGEQVSETDRVLQGYRRMQPLIDDMRQFFTIKGVDREGDQVDGFEALRQRAESVINNPEIPEPQKKPYRLALEAVAQGNEGVKRLATQVRELEDGVAGLDPELAPEAATIKARKEARRKRREARRAAEQVGINRTNAETQRTAVQSAAAAREAEGATYMAVDRQGNPVRPVNIMDPADRQAAFNDGLFITQGAPAGGDGDFVNVGPPGEGPTQVIDLNSQEVPAGMIVYGEADQDTGGNVSASVAPLGGSNQQPTVAPGFQATADMPPNALRAGTGPIDRFAALIGRSPMLGAAFPNREQTDAVNFGENFRKDLERAVSNNPRFAEGEQRRIVSITQLGGVLTGDNGAISQASEVRRGLVDDFLTTRQTLQNPNLTDSDISNLVQKAEMQRAAINTLDSMLIDAVVPPAAERLGVTLEEWQRMPMQDKQLFLDEGDGSGVRP